MLMHLNIVESYKINGVLWRLWVFMWHGKLLIEIWKYSSFVVIVFIVDNLEKRFPYFLKIIFNTDFKLKLKRSKGFVGDLKICIINHILLIPIFIGVYCYRNNHPLWNFKPFFSFNDLCTGPHGFWLSLGWCLYNDHK